MDIWQIETLKPVPLPLTAHVKFDMEDLYIVLRLNAYFSFAKSPSENAWDVGRSWAVFVSL